MIRSITVTGKMNVGKIVEEKVTEKVTDFGRKKRNRKEVTKYIRYFEFAIILPFHSYYVR